MKNIYLTVSSEIVFSTLAVISTSAACAEALPESLGQNLPLLDGSRPAFMESFAPLKTGQAQLQAGTPYTQYENNNERLEQTTRVPLTLRYGVAKNVELQMNANTELQTEERNDDPNQTTTLDGLGNKPLSPNQVKLNRKRGLPVIGWLLNQSTTHMNATMFRGNGIKPILHGTFEKEYANGLVIGWMPGFALNRNPDGKSYITGVFGWQMEKTWSERSRSYVEVAAKRSGLREAISSRMQFKTGTAYLVDKNTQIDFALIKGIGEDSGYAATLGYSVKF